jgi:RNA polymerase sigma-70 factor (ECF subfamily)
LRIGAASRENPAPAAPAAIPVMCAIAATAAVATAAAAFVVTVTAAAPWPQRSRSWSPSRAPLQLSAGPRVLTAIAARPGRSPSAAVRRCSELNTCPMPHRPPTLSTQTPPDVRADDRTDARADVNADVTADRPAEPPIDASAAAPTHRATHAPTDLPTDADALLVQRAAAGDALAFEVLVVTWQRRVAAAIRALVRDARITEELTQEVFLRVHGALADFQPGGSFRAWVLTIARNTASSYLRSGQNRLDDRPAAHEADDDADRGAAATTVFTHAGSAEDEAAARQLFALIDRSIAALPPAQRTALLMREIDDLDYRAIALAMGLPVNTVKSHIFRAREAVAARIRPLLAPMRGRRW